MLTCLLEQSGSYEALDVRGEKDTGQAVAVSATRSPVAVAHEIWGIQSTER